MRTRARRGCATRGDLSAREPPPLPRHVHARQVEQRWGFEEKYLAVSFYSDGLWKARGKRAPRARKPGVCVERWVFEAGNKEERDRWHRRIFDAQLECLRRAVLPIWSLLSGCHRHRRRPVLALAVNAVHQRRASATCPCDQCTALYDTSPRSTRLFDVRASSEERELIGERELLDMSPWAQAGGGDSGWAFKGLMRSIDLRARMPFLMRQGDIGMCVSASIVNLLAWGVPSEYTVFARQVRSPPARLSGRPLCARAPLL